MRRWLRIHGRHYLGSAIDTQAISDDIAIGRQDYQDAPDAFVI